MTTIERINAMTDIMTAINHDIANRPDFMLTAAQLECRIFNYLDTPDATADDFISIRRMLSSMLIRNTRLA